MKSFVQKIAVACCLFFVHGFSCNAQIEKAFNGCACSKINNKLAKTFFAELEIQEKLTIKCEHKIQEEQLTKFGRVLPSISGFCGGGCIVSLAMPKYPSDARRLRIFGQVKVETIINEQGNVIYARVLKGNPFLNYNARLAACRSIFTPLLICDGKPVKFRRVINYNFILN